MVVFVWFSIFEQMVENITSLSKTENISISENRFLTIVCFCISLVFAIPYPIIWIYNETTGSRS